MRRLPPRSTRTDPLFPDTTLFRSHPHRPVEPEVQRAGRRFGLPLDRPAAQTPGALTGGFLRLVGGPGPLFDERPSIADERQSHGRMAPPVQLGDREMPLFRHSKAPTRPPDLGFRSEEHTSELQSLMLISYAVVRL